jgi:hypothetical protein
MMSRHSQAALRLGTVAALIVSIAACDAERDRTLIAPPTAPTPSSPAPPQPSANTAVPPPSASPLTGTVFEFAPSGDRRPAPNLRLRVRKGSSLDGAVGGVELPDVVTDSNGRYEIAGLANTSILFFSTAPGSDHRFLCDYHPLLVPAEPYRHLSTDLPVVHVSWSGDRLPPGVVNSGVYGTVSERVNGTLRPVAGATVTLDSGIQDPPATTNAAGFYMVCSVVGTDQTRAITARKDGYRTAAREFFGGWDFQIDLELTPD